MYNSINEEIVHINGHPQKLIIFLHGYIDNVDHLDKSIYSFVEGIDNVAIHLPQAPLSCEVLDDKRQWYSMHRFDPDDERKTVVTMEECIAIYDRMSLGLYEAFSYLNEYIDQTLSEYQLEDKDLYLCGFSQGAMLALYTSLMRENKMAGCISFSGMLAGHSFLTRHRLNTPDTLLIHGNSDNLVRFEALEFTKNCLLSMGVEVEAKAVDGGMHRISEEGLSAALEFIKRHISITRKIAI